MTTQRRIRRRILQQGRGSAPDPQRKSAEGAGLSGLFGMLALLLAALGLDGVMAFAGSRRTVEIGIRMALGAERTAILEMILREAVALVAMGLALFVEKVGEGGIVHRP